MIKMEFERYAAYKDSGVEWLGEVPECWEVKRLKDVGKNGLTNGIFKTKDYYGFGVKLVNVTDLYSKNSVIDIEKLDRVSATENEISKYFVKDGDIFFVRSSLKLEGIGVSAIFENGKEKTIFECHIIRFRPNQKQIFPRFAIYQLNSNEIRYKFVVVSKTVTMTTISQEKVATIDLIFPTLQKQIVIANYLDIKTAQIDRKIELLIQKASLYGKLKQSLINETVTRGLDKTVPMKDSGVEWIGEIPAHWEVKRVKDLAKSTNGGAFKDDLVEFGIPIIKIQQLTLSREATDFCDSNSLKIKKDNSLKSGDLVFSWSTLISPFIYRGIDAVLNQHIFKITHSARTDKIWLFYKLMQSSERLLVFSHGSTMQHILKSDFDNLEIETPPLAEQQAIADYLDTKTANIDNIIETLNAQVGKLKELRKTLINDVVTGKIKMVKEDE